MAQIVVMEDDAGTRLLVSSVLRKDGHEVLAAEDGLQGLQMLRSHTPQLVISDVQMPGMNGFDVLASIRKDPRLAGLPVILLTSLQERAHMRIGMTSGADDYITKPFRAAELRQAVDAQLNKRAVRDTLQAMAVDSAVNVALQEQRDELAKLYEERLAAELSERWPSQGADGTEGDVCIRGATVLFADIPGYPAFAAALTPAEMAGLVKRFYGNANDAAHLFGARWMRFVGEGLLAVFAPEADTRTVNHTLRAARTALALQESAHGIRAALQARHPGLPPFETRVSLHVGDVTLTRLVDPLHGSAPQLLAVGDAVSLAILLQKQAHPLGWPVIASVDAARALTGALRAGARAMIDLPGRCAPVDAVEVLGLLT